MNPNDRQDDDVHFPDWKLERFLLEELDAREMEEIRRAADVDGELRSRLDALEQSNREILREYPPDRMGGQIRERLAEEEASATTAAAHRGWRGARLASRRGESAHLMPGRGWRAWFAPRILAPAGVIAIVAFAVFVLPHLISPGGPDDFGVTRLKGDSPQLRLHRKTEEGSERLEDGALASEHDLILLQYQTNDRPYGVILSVDGRGTITRHLPEHGKDAQEMELGRSHLTDYAFELDDAPGWEVFFFVTSSEPFTIDLAARAVEGSLVSSGLDSLSGAYRGPPADLDLPESFLVSRFTLFKEENHED